VPFRLPPRSHLILVVVAFYATAALSTHAFGTLSPIWYSNAIVTVALLLHPAATWPAFLLGVFLADVAVYARFGFGPPLLLASGDLFEIAGAAALISVTGGVRRPIFEGTQLARVVLACVVVPLFSGAFTASVLSADDQVDFMTALRGSYMPNALGLVVACPFLLSWSDPELRAQSCKQLTLRRVALLAAGVVLAAYLVQSELHDTLLFLSFPVVFALAWNFGLLGATLGMLAVTVAGVWSTFRGSGALAHLLGETTLAARIEAAQVYVAAILLSSLPVAVLQARQKKLADSLRRAGETRTEFLAAMSHEIRTPMTGVLGLVDLLAADHLSVQQRRYVEAMRASGRYLLHIINDILDFSRIESGRLELEEVDFSLAELLEHVRSQANPLAIERGLVLRIETARAEADVLRGDPLRLQQVLLNLVGNAIKFTEHGSVTLAVATRPRDGASGSWLRAEVRDTGVGIEPGHLHKLFTAFTQADRSIARQYGGTGLGLAISKRLVDAMGGTIAVASVPGQGSVFAFEVPLQPGDPAHLSSQLHGAPAPVPPLRILVAEDVEINREILRAALARHGHELAFAENGAEALELVQREPFDVVLMDVQMPVMDGVEATRRIRALPGPASRVAILGLTANVMAREHERYLGAGMDDCLPKPIDWDRLHAALARHARGLPVEVKAREPQTQGALLDEGALAALRHMAGDDELAELLRIGMGGYDATCERIAAADATADTVQQQAHKLKGSSGTLGLVAVSRLAEQIEDAAEQGVLAVDLISQLRPTIAATRAELVRRGVLRAPEPSYVEAAAAGQGAGRPSR
jgi:signal transduction histidine kinase/CheY-like chemotaxis protein/HPt (histidine-containing phosphotransfer) domain-containing protein